MKAAIVRLSGSTTERTKNTVGNAELFGIAKMLNLNPSISVEVLTAKECSDCKSIHSKDFNINDYDTLLVLNDSTNMFGGAEIKSTTDVYKELAKFDKQIYYILTDLSLPFVDYYKLIENKPWNNYNKDDFKLKHDIIVLSQAKDEQSVRKIHKVNIKDVVYVPWQEWKLYTEEPITNDNKTFDLIYGGCFRSGRREKKFTDYFFNKDLNIKLYGNIKRKQFSITDTVSEPTFFPKINNTDVLAANSEAYATILLGDANYNNNVVTLRFIEALLSNIVCFIDDDFDKQHTLLPDEFFYVRSGAELESKIKQIKNDKELYFKLLKIQRDTLLILKIKNLPKYVGNILKEVR